MVILTSSGFQIKEKCGELSKLVRNKKVFICNNAIDRALYKDKHFQNIKDNITETYARLDAGELTSQNAIKFLEYYDVIYIAEGNMNLISDMLSRKDIKDALLFFINAGKIFITEGLASHIVSKNLDYLDFITNSLNQEDQIYKKFKYKNLETLSLTKDCYIFHADKISKEFRGACKLAEKQFRTTFIFLNDGELLVL